MDVRSLHAQQTCRRMPEIVKTEIVQLLASTQAREGHADLARCDTAKYTTDHFRFRRTHNRRQHGYRRLVEIHNTPFAVLSLREQDASMRKINIQPTEFQNLRAAHSGRNCQSYNGA